MGGRGWMWGKRRKRIIFVDLPSECVLYVPTDPRTVCLDDQSKIVLTYVELQALKLVYLDNLTQYEAAMKMGIPRSTLWRIIENARRKIVQALVERRPILIARSERGEC
ncbi:MAG: DUF134 domain-containing protein [Crenarchaeota archaeon]|jgi:predicted DNA-binding protein (UPF0251 family)|nr:DUF134 domain-containing protein [Thermoproteota archaeon]